MSSINLLQLEERVKRYSLNKSHQSNVPVKVSFYNSCKHPINIWWLDYRGEKVQYYGNVRIVPGFRCDMKTFLTHPWQFTISGTEDPVYAKYSQGKRKDFEVLTYLHDQLKNGKICSAEFRRKIQGQDSIAVRIGEFSSLTEMSVSVIAEALHRRYRGGDLNTALENIEIPDILKEEVIKTYDVIKNVV